MSHYLSTMVRARAPALSSLLMLVALGVVVLIACFTTGADAVTVEQRPLYKDLGVATDATRDDIRRAFRRLTREHHPDLKETYDEKDEAKVTMTRVLRAYAVLSDDIKRMDYDGTGFIPGEAIDPSVHSTKDIFDHYKQKTPIFSKTETLESVTLAERIKNFRGNRVFLIQIYDDACKKCKSYSNVWEMMSHSGLVTAGVLKMYRVDAKSVEGPELIYTLGTRYNNQDPTIIAYVDGEKWGLFGIEAAMKRSRDRIGFEHLLDFAMNFFYEPHLKVRSLQAPTMGSVESFLKVKRPSAGASRSHQPAVPVLFPQIEAESVPLAIQMRYGSDVVVRSISRTPLLDFVEQHCEQEVEVVDRRGDPVPLPEFIVVSTELLDDDKSGHGRTEGKCNGIHIGSSAELTYEKASQFVQGLLPSPFEGLNPVEAAKFAYLDAMSFFDVCGTNCVIWARQSCAAPVDDLAKKEVEAIAKVLANDFLSFKSGYFCLDEQPAVGAFLAERIPDSFGKTSHRGPLVLAMMDSDDSRVFALTGLQKISPLDLSTRHVDAVLSDMIDQRTGERATVDGVVALGTGTALSGLIPTSPFPISIKHRYWLLFNVCFNFVSPYFSSFFPFVGMWFIHTRFLNKNGPDAEAEAAAAAAAATAAGGAAPAGEAATAQGPATGVPTAATPMVPPRPNNIVSVYTSQDLEDAKTGRGFLVIMVDDRPDSSQALRLPLCMSDSRLTVRMVVGADAEWKGWILNKSASTGGDTASVPEEENGLLFFAVRRGKMMGAVKPQGKTIDAFVGDLLDGSIPVQTELPGFATS